MWLAAPVLAAAWAAGRAADARNTVSFFRIMGGTAAALLWLPVLIVAAVLWPGTLAVPALAGIASLLIGWVMLGRRSAQPFSAPLAPFAAPEAPGAPKTSEPPSAPPPPERSHHE